MIVTAVFLTLVLLAAVTDLARHKIYNATTYPGILAALAWNASGSVLLGAAGIDPRTLEALGWIGIGSSLLGLLACGSLMLVCYVFFKVGGGDVKLMAMLGAFLGPERGLEAMLWTFVLGACLALVVLIWRVGPWRLLLRALRQVVWTLRLARWSPLSEAERAQLQPPLFLAPCALAGVVIVEFVRF